MSNAPTQFSEFGVAPAPGAGPTRTSALAIATLVLGILSLLVCWFPVVGLVAGVVVLVLAIASLVLIGRSGGAVGGRGLAIGGLACAAVGILLNVMVIAGGAMFLRQIGAYGTVVADALAEDQSGLEQHLSSSSVSAVTPEDLARFRSATLEGLGKFQGVRTGVMDVFRGYSKMESLQPHIPAAYLTPSVSRSFFVLPADFEKGGTSICLYLSPRESGGLPMGKVIDMGVVMPDDTIVWLIGGEKK